MLLKNGTTEQYYYYLYNAQGDVIGIIDSSGATVVNYTYDVWGKPVSTTGSLASTVGQNNPIRYRGYYYDTETGFYYLQSRYYDPEIGRFINADGYASTGQGILGTNMFAYCGNNPVNRADPSGQAFGIAALISMVIATVAIAVTTAVAVNIINSPAVHNGFQRLSSSISSAASDTIAAGSSLAKSFAKDYTVDKSVTKSKGKEKDIAIPLPPSTVVYRYGGTNPGNLTPKKRINIRDYHFLLYQNQVQL